MSWNKYYIVVTNQQGATSIDILTKLGLNGYQPAGDTSFLQTNKSDDLFIGTYKDKLVIANSDLTYGFFDAEPSDIEKNLWPLSLFLKLLHLQRTAPSENLATHLLTTDSAKE